MKILNLLAIAAISAAVFSSCKKDDNNNNNNGGTNATTFKVRMTDAPGNFMAMNTQLTSVEALVDGEWVTLNSTSQNVSVLSLTNGNEEVVANDGTAETGHYTQLRFNFGTANTITMMENGEETQHDLAFALGANTSVLVNIDKQVDSGDDETVLIDFNVANSISSALGNWFMNPDMTWVQDEATGARGQITGAARAMIHFVGDNGEEYWSWVNNEGRFLVRGMVSGTYDVVIQGMKTGETAEDEMTMENVVVAQGSITNMGSFSFE